MSHLIPTYNRTPISFTHGKGVWLFAKTGEKYLDFISGIGVNSLGHSHPSLVNALEKQSKKLWHVSNLYEIPEQLELAKVLCKATGFDAAFFANSGTEATEAAIKLARKHTGRKEIISFTGGFHGRTMGALSITAKKSIKKDFAPLVPGCKIIEFNNGQELEKTVSSKTAAVIFECVQGEGGINLINKKFLAQIFKLARKYKFLVIADEVQAGMGRTGYFLASDYFKIKPDIVTLAKGLGGGFPIGAILTRKHISQSFNPGSHGSTFGGNLLACAASLAAVNEIKKANFLKSVKANSEYLLNNLKKTQKKYHKIILDIRGIGFMLGLEINDVKTRDLIIKILREKYHVLTVVSGEKVLRILPPLIVSKANIDWFILKLEEALDSI